MYRPLFLWHGYIALIISHPFPTHRPMNHLNHLNTLPTAGLIIVRHQALLREIREELALDLETEQLHFYTHISAPAYGETPAVMMAQDCFRCELGDAIPQAQAEISAVRYFTLAEFQHLDIQVAGMVQVYARLQADGLV